MTLPSIDRDELVALTVKLARIDSTNTTLVPGAAGERAVGQFVADWMAAKGWGVTVEWPAPDRPNVVGTIKGNGGQSLLINAHLDTVGAKLATMQVRVEGDRIYGRGVLDTKGGLAAALVAAEAVASLPPAGDIIIAAVCDEEAGSIGTDHLLTSTSAAAAVVIEPTDLQVVVAHPGFAVIECVFHGRASHTSKPEDGINAITPAVAFVQSVARYAEELASRDDDALFGRPTAQITRIDGGTELFTTPDRCAVVVELRTVPDQTPAGAIGRIESLVNEARAQGHSVESRRVIVRDPLSNNADQAITTLLADALCEQGHPGDVVGARYWTDAALVDAHHIPVAVFGPGGQGIHSDEEWIAIDDLVTCSATLAKVMAEFGRNAAPQRG
ncbi:MAG: M20/M25/M40 family metallo-hydrolase [Actinomycetia bacterium]|nr:M20/M25/M40 family metallo-hydrolase [Actinomycetes bacterium]